MKRPFGRGSTTPGLGDLLNIITNHLLMGYNPQESLENTINTMLVQTYVRTGAPTPPVQLSVDVQQQKKIQVLGWRRPFSTVATRPAVRKKPSGNHHQKKNMVDTEVIWVLPKIMGKPLNHPFVHRVFHYFHHPFWGIPIWLDICSPAPNNTVNSVFFPQNDLPQNAAEFLIYPPILGVSFIWIPGWKKAKSWISR